jgi:hypothetical protein
MGCGRMKMGLQKVWWAMERDEREKKRKREKARHIKAQESEFGGFS